MTDVIHDQIETLVNATGEAYVSSVDADGYPNVKAMYTLERDGLFTHYFSTNCSAERTGQFRSNAHACIYFCNPPGIQSLMLIGDAEVCTDIHHKTRLWREGFERYYPGGIEDEDYCVLKFTARSGKYYDGLRDISITFAKGDWENQRD